MNGHKTRAEQRAINARKDPNQLAKRTKPHRPKVDYKRKPKHQREWEDHYVG